VFGKVSRGLFSASIVAVIAGCSSSTPSSTTDLGLAGQPPAAAVTPVVQANCPPITMRENTAYYRTYAKGGENDPTKIIYQASFADSTRACTINEVNMTINVVVQGRLVAGPAGGAGRVSLPVRVSVIDGDSTLYSELTNFSVDLPAGVPSTQFVFNKADITIPTAVGGASNLAKLYVGFETGPQKKPALAKSARR
jgi:hypothetical protein